MLNSFYSIPETISIGFILALMGWMPAPVEASTWSSLWLIEKQKISKSKITLSDTILDFRIGYFTTAILACIFLSLGAFAFFSSGETLANGAIGFTIQLVEIYTVKLGDWAMPLVATLALATMVSTTLTVVDAYPRALEESLRVLGFRKKNTYKPLVVFVALGALTIISFFQNNLLDMIDFVTIVSFLAAPFFGLINTLAVTNSQFPKESRPGRFSVVLSFTAVLVTSTLCLIYFIY
ncbi:MAG: hypothetical protein Kapaf2KO_20140 [Candidatus Kapaibacteriales bacterium]